MRAAADWGAWLTGLDPHAFEIGDHTANNCRHNRADGLFVPGDEAVAAAGVSLRRMSVAMTCYRNQHRNAPAEESDRKPQRMRLAMGNCRALRMMSGSIRRFWPDGLLEYQPCALSVSVFQLIEVAPQLASLPPCWAPSGRKQRIAGPRFSRSCRPGLEVASNAASGVAARAWL
jgi:hypothetical protein